jgi:ribosomal protein S8E
LNTKGYIYLGLALVVPFNANGAPKMSELLNTNIQMQSQERGIKIVDELCVFNCKLKEPKLIEITTGLDNLYFLLRAKYGLNTEVQCKLYRKVKGNSPIELRGQRLFPQGNSNFYSEEILNDSNTWKFFNGPVTYTLGSNTLGLSSNISDLGNDIYADLISMVAINSPNISQNDKNQYILTLQQRHKFITKSCGQAFITAYDRYLDNFAERIQNELIIEDQIATDKKEKERLAKQLKEEERKRRADQLDSVTVQSAQEEKQKKMRLEQCEVSNAYNLYLHSNYIVNAKISIKLATQALEHENRIAAIGSSTNLTKRHQQATIIENAQSTLNNSFPLYKEFGGNAKNVSSVTRLKNPCL